jgi:hypothetical protein
MFMMRDNLDVFYAVNRDERMRWGTEVRKEKGSRGNKFAIFTSATSSPLHCESTFDPAPESTNQIDSSYRWKGALPFAQHESFISQHVCRARDASKAFLMSDQISSANVCALVSSCPRVESFFFSFPFGFVVADNGLGLCLCPLEFSSPEEELNELC